MPKYLIEARYTAEGVKGIKSEGGSARRANAMSMMESLGGKVEAFYFAYGEVDVYCICDVPDEKRAIAASIAANQTGAVSLRLTPLISPETVDEAAKLAVTFRPPGR